MTSTHPTAPIILIGAARSGTKFVRDLLATDSGIAAVPYDVNYVWRIGQQSLSHDALDPSSLTPKRMRLIRSAIHRLAERGGANAGRKVLEKTVSNCLRVPFVAQVFPEAKFIHLVRDGRAVVESSSRLWQSPPDAGSIFRKLRNFPPESFDYLPWFAMNYARGLLQGRSGGEVWGPRYPGIMEDVEKLPLADVVIRQWAECVSRASVALDAMEPGQTLTVRYEDLMTSEDQVRRICQFAGVSDPDTVLKTFHRTVRPENAQKWQSTLSGDTRRRTQEIASALLQQYGYL